MNVRREGGNGLVLGCFALAHLLILTVVYHTVYRAPFSGIQLFFDFASKVVGGRLPYRDFPLEYPPFALLFFVLPRLAASTIREYYIWYQVEVVLVDLVALVVLDAIAKARGMAAWPTLAAFTLAVVAVGPIIGQQFDIFPAVLALIAVYYLWRGEATAGWVLLTLGTLTKLFPLLLAPLLLLSVRGRRWTHSAARAAGIGAATTVIVLTPWLIGGPTSLMRFFAYHSERGIQLESTYATVVLFSDTFGWTLGGTRLAYGSWNVVGPVAAVLTPVSTIVFIGAMVSVFLFIRARPPQRDSEGRIRWEWLASCSLLTLSAALITSKVLSPQYLIWLIPFVPFVSAKRRALVWIVFAVAGVVTYYIFPMHYMQLIRRVPSAEVALLVRNVLLVALTLLAGASVRDASLVGCAPLDDGSLQTVPE